MTLRRIVTLILPVLLAIPAAAHATSIGIVDTFQNGTTNGWFAGGLGVGQLPPIPPTVVATGGPNGAGDAFLKITAIGGSGAGSKLVAINGSQWTGDYIAAGVTTIQMDLKNLGSTSLMIRLLFEDPLFGPPVDEGVTTAGVFLPASGGWVHFAFAVAPGSLTMLAGNATTLLHNTTLLRIINAATAGDADVITGQLGVDNICAGSAKCASAVPEPTTMLLTAAGLALIGVTRRRRPTRS